MGHLKKRPFYWIIMMNFRLKPLKLILLTFYCFSFLSSTSNAFLGEQKNNGIAHSQSYSIVETSHGKNRLKEYVSNSGQVFAVTWSGYSHPDLSEILGSYWSEYNTAIKKHKPNHFEKHFTQSTKNIVIEKSGHFRSVKGRAYILKLLPAGVNLNAIE